MTDDDDDEMERAFKQAIAEAMPEVRARGTAFRERVAKFFDLKVEHLPDYGNDGWSRLLATYVWTVKPYAVEDLRHMLDRKIFSEEAEKVMALLVKFGLPTDAKVETVRDVLLLAYSSGRIGQRDAVQALEMRDSTELLVALGDANLPMPMPPPDEIERQADLVMKMLKG
ncbi:MAG: hypothetical protein ACK5X0_07415 [Rhodospirillales bacterium]